MKRPPGMHVSSKLRTRGLKMLAHGAKSSEIERKLSVSPTTVWRWQQLAKLAKPAAPTVAALRIRRKPLVKTPTPASYIAKQLTAVAGLIREKLPELTAFSLTMDATGKASVAYAVKQTTVITGSVKL